ncbi:MAG: CBS domain-containing protein, partial [Clostridia bacterium]|nr:CBS domain-containing protein [Clostridia bacterium]
MDFSMMVKEIMTPGVVSVTLDDTIGDAARLMSSHGVGALPVCGDAGELRGMITDRDLAMRCVAADFSPETTRVGSVMTRTVIAVEQRADDRRLHQDLGWEYCGPAPGVTNITPASPPPETQRLPIEIT